MSPVRSSVNERSAPAARRRARRARRVGAAALGAAAAQQPVLGEHGELQLRRDEPLAQRRRREAQRRLERRARADVDALAQPARFQAAEVVGRALAFAAARERDDRRGSRSARASRAPARLRRASAPPCPPTARAARSAGRRRCADSQMRARSPSAAVICSGLTYRWCASVVAEGRAHVAPVVAQRRRELLLGRDDQLRPVPLADAGRAARRSARPAAARRCPGARAVLAVARRRELRRRGDLGQLAVLGGELGRRRDLDLLDVAERALREGREPAQRFDLDVEHVDAHGALLGRREHVEQPAAHRELPALLDLVDALVAGARRARPRTRRGRAARRPAA